MPHTLNELRPESENISVSDDATRIIPSSQETIVQKALASELDAIERSLVQRLESAAQRSVTKAIEEASRTHSPSMSPPPAATGYLPAEPMDPRAKGLAGFSRPGEYWRAVANAGSPGGQVDKRLFDLASKSPSGLNTLVGSEGGYLVPPQIANRLLELVFADHELLARTDFETIRTTSIELNAVKDVQRSTGNRRGGIQGYWVAEGSSMTASRPAFRKMTLRPHKLAVFYYATDEELADVVGFSLEQKLADYAAEEINWMVADAIVAGDGVGKPLGFLNAPATVTVTKESGQAADTITFANIVKMRSRFFSLGGSPVWLANIDTMPQLVSLAFPTSNAPLFLNTASGAPNVTAAPQATLFGIPIVFLEQCPTLGDRGDLCLVDLRAYKSVARGLIDAAMSIHVRFEYGETAFRFEFRIDGQPWLEAPIAPAKGSATQSPFIVLADRA